jgi:TRAP-type uncharacterized transport system substrate-binding protein
VNDSISVFVRKSRNRLYLLLSVGIALIVFGLLAWVSSATRPRFELRATGGVSGLNRSLVTDYLSRRSGRTGVQLIGVSSGGTVQATERLQQGELDLAVVNALVRSPSADRIRQVAPLGTECLHFLVKREHAAAVREDWANLAGLTVNLGETGGESEAIAKSVLAFCGVRLPGDASGTEVKFTRRTAGQLLETISELTESDAAMMMRVREQMPDVVIHSELLPSTLARGLIEQTAYELIALPFAKAFSRVTVREEERDSDHVDQAHVIEAEIPAFMYGASPASPPRDLPTLGFPLILICHEDVRRAAIYQLMPAIFEGTLHLALRPPPLSEVRPTYPWHPASLAYQNRDQPILKSDVAEAAQSTLNVLAPILGGCLALYGFYRWRQTLKFLEYFEEYQELDLEAKGLAADEIVTPTEALKARRLETRLTRLQQRAVGDFCRNYFHGEGVLENFLQLLSETRSFLRSSSVANTSPPPTSHDEPSNAAAFLPDAASADGVDADSASSSSE